MKKLAMFASLALAAAFLAAAPAADPGAASSPAAGAQLGQAESEHYIVVSERGRDRAAALSRQLEALFARYDGLFRYDASALTAKLNVREFAAKAGFDAYLAQVVGQTKDDFVYLHYETPGRSELLVFPKAEPDFSASLAHQGFVQFLKAFVSNPPLWIREGAAIYFESAVWDDKAGKLDLPENLAWLESVKSLKERKLLMSVDKLLSIGQDEARSELDVFYPQSWAFVSFLINSGDKSYNRLLWDSLAALKKDASLDENQAAVAKIASTWYGMEAIEESFAAYLADRKTFPELVSLGVSKYADKAWDEARAAFEKAQSLNAASYVPDYYLGLIAYAQNQLDSADSHYRQALALGCESATANYALGVNAYAQNRLEDAKKYLQAAKSAAPDRYGEKADALLARIK
jgi:Flp pilus assembly protein TadD, contains TPR repeats